MHVIIECELGTYGVDCMNNCSRYCKKEHICNRKTGEYDGGCIPGWEGIHCDNGMVTSPL